MDHSLQAVKGAEGRTCRCRLMAAGVLGLLLVGACLSGCAQAAIVPAQDKNSRWYRLFPQKGPRFYLPRPYIAVLKEYPVASKVQLVPAYMSPKGLLVQLDANASRILGDDLFLRRIGSRGPRDANGGTWAMLRPTGQTPAIWQQTAGSADTKVDEAAAEVVGAVGKAQAEATTQPTTQPAREREAVHGGTAKAWVKKGDITEFRESINSLYEIRYLPDFDEQYVIQSEAGLGMVSLDAYLARGWVLQHYGKEVDRRELGRMVFSTIQDVIDIARTAGKAALSASLPSSIPAMWSSWVFTAATEEEVKRAKEIKPVRVIVKIMLVEYAVPGVYPILKPAEIRQIHSSTQPATRAPLAKPPSQHPSIVWLGDGTFQAKPTIAMPVGYRTRRDIHVAAVNLLAGAGPAGKPPSGDGKTWDKGTIEKNAKLSVITALRADYEIKTENVKASYTDGKLALQITEAVPKKGQDQAQADEDIKRVLENFHLKNKEDLPRDFQIDGTGSSMKLKKKS